MKAHRLIHHARVYGKATDVAERLFHAYFTEGKNTDDAKVLAEIGASCGLDKNEVLDMLSTDEYKEDVHREQDEARQLGCRGVPFFVFDRRYGVSGAQPQNIFLSVLQKAQDTDLDGK